MADEAEGEQSAVAPGEGAQPPALSKSARKKLQQKRQAERKAAEKERRGSEWEEALAAAPSDEARAEAVAARRETRSERVGRRAEERGARATEGDLEFADQLEFVDTMEVLRKRDVSTANAKNINSTLDDDFGNDFLSSCKLPKSGSANSVPKSSNKFNFGKLEHKQANAAPKTALSKTYIKPALLTTKDDRNDKSGGIRKVEPALASMRGSSSLLSKSANMKTSRVELTSEKMITHLTDLKREHKQANAAPKTALSKTYIKPALLTTKGDRNDKSGGIGKVEPALASMRGSSSLLSKSANMKTSRVEPTSETALNQLSGSSKARTKMTTHPTDLKREHKQANAAPKTALSKTYIKPALLTTKGDRNDKSGLESPSSGSSSLLNARMSTTLQNEQVELGKEFPEEEQQPPERINRFRNLLLKTICERLISVRNKVEEIMELLDETRGSHTISSE
ncbi:unnamed protein product [Urochloa humidicola]